jgi:TRAP-type C4-dicarboxylate transport system permease small subunit
MLLIVALILVEIASRAVLGVSTLIAAEYSGYLLVGLVLLGFAYTIGEGGFIRINIVRARLPAGAQRALDIFACVFSAVITAFVFRYSVIMVYETKKLGMQADTIAETPFWIPQLVVPLGLAMLFLQLVAMTVRRVRPS